MAGGTWTVQNKVRPGAYVNFRSVTKPDSLAAAKGIATMPLVLNWGAEAQMIEILSTDLTDGTIKKKLGYDAGAEELLLVRECLSNCYKLLVYRVNTDGEKATATLGALTATAKHSGMRGNGLSVAVLAVGELEKEVVTYLDRIEVNRQKVSAVNDLVDNDYIIFSGFGSLDTNAATSLTGGADGTASATNYEAYFELLKSQDWQVMGLPLNDTSVIMPGIDAVKNMRENLGKKVQAVVYNSPANYEGIISTKQGYVGGNGAISAIDFIAYATGISAGAQVESTNTYHEIKGAVNIINPLSDDEIKTAINDGYMVISRRTDGKIVIENDYNTLTTFTDTKNRAFRKNRLIRTVDDICNNISLIFENTYIGKVDNNVTGRELLKQAIVKYVGELQNASAIKDFTQDDITVEVGNDPDSVIVTLGIQPVDAMEKLYMTVEVD